MSVVHDTFVIERRYDATRADVFAAWSELERKRLWFGAGDGPNRDLELDFRVDGIERNAGGPEGGPHYTYEARYRDIVDAERIVYDYEMAVDGARMSVSLAVVELHDDGAGTRMVYTEHGAYLDDLDDPRAREHGTGELLDNLGRALSRAVA